MALSIEMHFKELKYRILYISFSWLITFFFSYLNVSYITYILTLPFLQTKKVNMNLNQSDFIFTNIFEAFSSYVLVSFVTTICLLLPVISYSCFAFLKSGLMKHEQKYTIFMIKLFLFCWSLALLFTHQIFLPFILNFFLSFEELVKTNLFTLKLEPKILDYLWMIINSFFLFTLIFQIPFSLFLLLNQNLINVHFLEKNRKSFLIISVIAGGVLTPPDIYTQLIIALPLCLFFEFILFLSYMKKLYEKQN